ncbi:MAG: sugar phosphate isomerase/epimerase family protein [Armatimonadota bacterium]|nr:sugar phosphate isomerase/epimerase [bacterium]
MCPAWHPGAERLVETIPILADQGVTAIEIGFKYPGFFDHHNGAELQQLMCELASSGVRVNSVHSPFGPAFDISNPNDEIHERGVVTLIESIELASVLEAEKVIVHASDIIVNGRGRQFDRARGVLREVAAIASESDIVIALENLPPGYLGHTPEELFALLDGIDRQSIAICFDSGHANLSGNFEEYAHELLPHAAAIHLHDNDGVSDQHKFPGEGCIDWHLFSEVYRRSGCEASVMLECAPPENIAWSEAFQKFRATLGE